MGPLAKRMTKVSTPTQTPSDPEFTGAGSKGMTMGISSLENSIRYDFGVIFEYGYNRCIYYLCLFCRVTTANLGQFMLGVVTLQ